jgi:phosphoribosyl 1,2-cyclic phosphodiesterase
MSQTPIIAERGDAPVRNMRIRFWGVQGSCPLFPEAHEVADYARMIALDLLHKVLQDVQTLATSGRSCRVEDLLGGSLTSSHVDGYLDRLGLANLPVYGGDTTCISIETSDGQLILLDAGSGIRNCSKFFTTRWPATRPRQISLFGTHEHIDHRSGIPFCQFCYLNPPYTIDFYGSARFLRAVDEGYGVFSRRLNPAMHMDDPIDYRVMAAKFQGHELRSPRVVDYRRTDTSTDWEVLNADLPIVVGKTTLNVFDVYHGSARCLAYKIQHGPATFVYCTDHEVRHGPDPADPRQQQSMEAEQRLIEHCYDADAAYFDGQYLRNEYDGKKGIGVTMPVSRLDWGHGCIEDVMARAVNCRIKRTFIGHHDPERTWGARLELDSWLQEKCRNSPYSIELAKAEGQVDL